MKSAVLIAVSVICNFILYLSFGSFITRRIGDNKETILSDRPDASKPAGSPDTKAGGNEESCPLLLSVTVGFFFYYFLFFIACIGPMKYYRPLSMLTGIWVPFVIAVVAVSFVINGKAWLKAFKGAADHIKSHPITCLLIMILIGVQAFLVSATYNFTLDAAYYVANVATSVETNMMNVYDPFTGAWQDHYEMRYFFATYQIQDALVCQITHIPALIWTKSVMAITVIILTNTVYYMIAGRLFTYVNEEDDSKKTDKEAAVFIMMVFMFIINLTFITIYTSSLFLMTRTYEGKAIVGNLAVLMIFYLFLKMNDDTLKVRPWLMTFLVCFGAASISSSANMLLPVELTVLFIPMIFRKKKWGMIFKYAACVIPGLVFSLIYVLYVKGYFVFYTFPK
ncbi:MAG TPA: hypothetical protein DIS78_05800 [Lachnospiraceae bacterium]|nr:hypothetical protein [Lachnospiraceae bacterium]